MRRSSSAPPPPEMREVVTRLRRWAAERDSDAFLFGRSFTSWGPDVEACAAEARVAVQHAADAVFNLLNCLERSRQK